MSCIYVRLLLSACRTGNTEYFQFDGEKVQDINYEFDADYTPEIADKKNVRAFYVDLRINKHGEQGGSKYVFATPSNGSAVE